MSTPGQVNAGGAVVTITARENVNKTLSQVERRFGTFAGKLDGLRKATEALKLYAVARGFSAVGQAIADADRRIADGEGMSAVAGDLVRNTMLLGDFVKGWDALVGVLTGNSAVSGLLEQTAKSADATATSLEKAQRRLEAFTDAAQARVEEYRRELQLLNEQNPATRRELGIAFGSAKDSASIQSQAAKEMAAISKEFDAPIKDLEKRVENLDRMIADATEQGSLSPRRQRIVRTQMEARQHFESQVEALKRQRDAQRAVVREAVSAQEAMNAQVEAAQLAAEWKEQQAQAARETAEAEADAAEAALQAAEDALRAFNLRSNASAAVRAIIANVAKYADDPVAAVRTQGGAVAGQFGADRLGQLAAASSPRRIERDIQTIAEEAKQQTKIQRQTLDAVEESLAPVFS
jgi:chromosome segregation ATPase